ncbi:hypothetical protein [Puia dinghuensis]|uniref:Uncharacterized protein n=1 Tax=Puia dinghuensis TaxID=1792502 RepID=A0A8J2XWF7_9BACT|nr:hypothetical protein [Puia dinghuensis]GGB19565.1 hypothetical protein GCM10011511_49120 [Puia dinghuensis]
MTDFSSLLGLPGATLQQLGDAYEGQAVASGNFYVLAAIYRSILDPGSSIPLFGIAAGIHRRQNNSIWKLLAICGFNQEWLLGQEAAWVGRDDWGGGGRESGDAWVGSDAREFYHELLRQYFLFNSGEENALGWLLEYASSSSELPGQLVGEPPIPLQEYLSLIRADIEKGYHIGEPAGNPAWMACLRLLLQRTAGQLQLMQRHYLQWSEATWDTGVRPFEPDILATLLCFCIRHRNREDFRLFIAEETHSGNPVFFLGQLAAEMIEAAG